MTHPPPQNTSPPLRPLPALIFASRWLQVPLYLGLIVAQGVYVWLFIEELIHLVALLWDPSALTDTVQRLGIGERNKETVVMLIVLSLILGVGMSWSILRQRLSGQQTTDEVDG